MSVQSKYRAVICGEEHIVKGWRGRKLLTEKGSFNVRHIYGDWQIQDQKILEVAWIQADGNGGWLVNGRPLSLLESLPHGERLGDIPRDENLRVYKSEICAVAWLDKTGNKAQVTDLLDCVLKFWNTASLAVVDSRREETFADFFRVMNVAMKHHRIFGDCWSQPVWLTEFRSTGKKIPFTSEQKKFARVANELQETKAQPANALVEVEKPSKNEAIKNNSAKRTAEFNENFSTAVIREKSGKENSVTVEPELRKLVEAIIKAGGHLPRTELRKDKADTWQPEKLLISKNAKLLVKSGLLGKKKTGRTTVFWVKKSVF